MKEDLTTPMKFHLQPCRVLHLLPSAAGADTLLSVSVYVRSCRLLAFVGVIFFFLVSFNAAALSANSYFFASPWIA